MKHSDKKIFFDEYVDINGIKQYLFHSGTKESNPVILFLHGGPGSAESIFSHTFQEKWENIFTVVHWDQRGAGKTLTKNKDKYPTIDLMLEDLFQVIQYLKNKYNKEKIILLGHSWGSILGSVFIQKYPEEVSYYIGVGQVIGMIENERVGYEKLKSAILKANDTKSLKKLESIGNYPGEKFETTEMKKCRVMRSLQGKYNLAVKISPSIFIDAFKSPIFKFSDLSALAKCFKANEKTYDFLWTFDLNSLSLAYKVPVYYILGENDWQVPYTLAQKYFNKITAPNKKLYLIPNAGHMTMMDEPNLFFDALAEINNIELLIPTTI